MKTLVVALVEVDLDEIGIVKPGQRISLEVREAERLIRQKQAVFNSEFSSSMLGEEKGESGAANAAPAKTPTAKKRVKLGGTNGAQTEHPSGA